MGSEQSHQQVSAAHDTAGNINSSTGDSIQSPFSKDSRPASPPMSISSDLDLPYTSYTDQPIGDSPKFRSKVNGGPGNLRSNSIVSRKPKLKQSQETNVHNIIVVTSIKKKVGVDKDEDFVKLQNIPVFLPIMGNSSYPSKRDLNILGKLQPAHLYNSCFRMQSYLRECALQVENDQILVDTKIKKVEQLVVKLYGCYVEKQKAYSLYAEHFSKIRILSQTLTRCNTLLNRNIESLETINSCLGMEHRLQPFIWNKA